MRILLIGPRHRGGSIPPYLDVLTAALRHCGARVDRLGSNGLPYDSAARAFWPADRIVETAENLLRDVDLGAYDLLSVHFGNLEVEQLLPSLWAHRRRPPAVYHVHSLNWTLFAAHVPHAGLRAAVVDGIRGMDGLVYFGAYGRDQLTRNLEVDIPAAISWLPTTIPRGTYRLPATNSRRIRTHGSRPTGTLYGYAAPWKDVSGLLTACRLATADCHLHLAGPLWNDPRQAGIDLTAELAGSVRHGPVKVSVAARYLTAADRKVLVNDSDFAVFPYRTQPTFQGSGAIADYLAHGVPVLATDVANMAELVGPSGLVVPAGDPNAFAAALDRIAGDADLRRSLAISARRRSPLFSTVHHVAQCLRFYQDIAATRRSPHGAHA